MSINEITLKFVSLTGLKLVSIEVTKRDAFYKVFSPTGIRLFTIAFCKNYEYKDEEDNGWHFWFVKDCCMAFELGDTK